MDMALELIGSDIFFGMIGQVLSERRLFSRQPSPLVSVVSKCRYVFVLVEDTFHISRSVK